MPRILMVGSDLDQLGDFTRVLTRDRNLLVSRASSAEEALAIVDREQTGTVIVAERLAEGDPLVFVRRLMHDHPLVNCAVISPLPAAEFHEATEGLGVFMQLPPSPGADHAEKMLQLLESIEVLMNL